MVKPKSKLKFGKQTENCTTSLLECFYWSHYVNIFWFYFSIFVLEVVQFSVCFPNFNFDFGFTNFYLFVSTNSFHKSDPENKYSIHVSCCRLQSYQMNLYLWFFLLRSPLCFSRIFAAFLVDVEHISMAIQKINEDLPCLIIRPSCKSLPL